MNPYDFVPIDWNRPPEQHKPVWHHRLFGLGMPKLYSGRLEVDLFFETPGFIFNPDQQSKDPTKYTEFFLNANDIYTIPGSSLKGMIRSVFETLGNGCLTLFDGDYKKDGVNYQDKIAPAFEHCTNINKLCIACRTFGAFHRGMIFLGKINISDAEVYPDYIYEYDPMYTQPLMTAKPHHASFYLDEKKQYIAGRKFFFHHSPRYEPLSAKGPTFMGGKPSNLYIQPLDKDTRFHFSIDFTNLEHDEFATLLLAITLDEGMRHKIGYGKPLGLGSIELRPTKLTLIDYTARYSRGGSKQNGGKSVWEGDDVWQPVYDYTGALQQKDFVADAMDGLRKIWFWPPNEEVSYAYPSKSWFDREGRGKRIDDTYYLE